MYGFVKAVFLWFETFMWLEISLWIIPEQSIQGYMWTQKRGTFMMTQKKKLHIEAIQNFFFSCGCDKDN
jgi:hypothetical protein